MARDTVKKSQRCTTELLFAAYEGNDKNVNLFISEGAEIDYIGWFDMSALHYAAMKGHDIIVDILIAAQAFTDINNRYLQTPLHLAAKNGHAKICCSLMNSKANIYAQDVMKKSPLHLAAENGHADAVSVFLNAHISVDIIDIDENTPLHLGAREGHTQAVAALLTANADPIKLNKAGETAIHLAAMNRRKDVVNLLLRFQPDDKFKDMLQFYDPLYEGVFLKTFIFVPIERFIIDVEFKLISGSQRGDINTVKESLYCGADINFADTFGLSPLHYAAKNGHAQLVTFLIKNRASKEISGRYYRKPLHWAILNQHTSVVSILLEAKVDVNCKDIYSKGPLHYATAMANYHLMALLIKHQANVNLNDGDGNTSLHIATSKGYTKAAFVLLNNKANVDAQNFAHKAHSILASYPGFCNRKESLMGETALHMAANKGDSTTLSVLLKYNPKLDTLDIMGYTPILRAEYFGHANAFGLLYDAGANFSIIKNKRLAFALKKGDIEVAEKCLSLGADVNYMEVPQGLYMLYSTPHHSPTTEEMLYILYKENLTVQGPYTPLHYAAYYMKLNVVSFLMKHKAKVDVQTIFYKRTPLHFTYLDDDLKTVKIILEYSSHIDAIKSVNCQDYEGKTILHFACSNGSLELVHYLLSTGYVKPMLANNQGYTAIEMVPPDHPKRYNIIKLFEPFQQGRNQCPIDSYTKLFICGKSSVGKSSLTQVIASRSTKPKDKTFTQYDMVTGVTPKTAGIIPHEIQSHEIGNVILHDFAGHPEYYNSHSAVLESLMLRSPGGFIVVVDLRDDRETIKRDLYFWINFIENVSCRLQKKSELLVIGSHPDLINPDKASTYQPYIDSVVIEILKSQEYRGFFAIDCRRLGGKATDRFMKKLSESCKALSDKSESISYYCFVLNAFLHTKLDVIALTLEQLIGKLEIENNASLPSNPSVVTDLLSILSDKGLILFIKNGTSNWVIIKKSTLLSEVNGILFAPKSIEKVHKNISSNTGVVPVSALKKVFPAYDTDMIVNFLLSLEFCHVVDYTVLNIIQTNVASPSSISEKLLFFSCLVLEDRPKNIQISKGYGWCLFCPRPNQFLSSRFVSLLLLHLAYTHCLKNRAIGQLKANDRLQQLAVSCNIWRNGIHWIKGVEVVVQVTEHNRCVTVLVSESDPVLCNHIFSSLIKEIVTLQKQLCPACYVEECIISPKSIKLALTSNIASLRVCPIQDVAHAIVTQQKEMYDDEGLAVNVRDIVGQFEPYCTISPLLMRSMFDDKMANEFLSQEVVDYVMKICSTLKLKIMVTKTTTYLSLRKQFNKFSIFAGKNPLTLAGNLTEDDIKIYSEVSSGILNFTEGTNVTHSDVLGKRPVKRDVLVLLADIKYLWHEIGEALEVKFGSLQSHLYSPYPDSRRLSLVIQEWMDSQTSDVTWSTLIEAIECPIVDQITIGQKIRDYLCEPHVQSQYLKLNF